MAAIKPSEYKYVKDTTYLNEIGIFNLQIVVDIVARMRLSAKRGQTLITAKEFGICHHIRKELVNKFGDDSSYQRDTNFELSYNLVSRLCVTSIPIQPPTDSDGKYSEFNHWKGEQLTERLQLMKELISAIKANIQKRTRR